MNNIYKIKIMIKGGKKYTYLYNSSNSFSDSLDKVEKYLLEKHKLKSTFNILSIEFLGEDL